MRDGKDPTESPAAPSSRPATFHAGERELQAGVGVEERMAFVGPRAIRGFMPEQHRAFFGQLPFILLGTLDQDGQPQAGVVTGPPGFAWSPDDRSLRIDSLPAAHDPSRTSLRPGAPVGLLGIQPHTRRRNRLNGRVREMDASGFTVDVEQSFGNCPQYIQAREGRFDPAAAQARTPEHSNGLGAAASTLAAGADTFFIATAHPAAGCAGDPAHGVDMSHRGGPPGFIEVKGSVLTVPDYSGNNFFNTLGNLLLEPRCSVLLPDFETGAVAWLQARAEVVDDRALVRRHPGAQRLVRLQVASSLHVPGALPLRWGAAELAPEFDFLGDR
jgi:predicted pyridoxine 5'-phosphate oxidase superfamily flavin-nucleotide-binding protein